MIIESDSSNASYNCNQRILFLDQLCIYLSYYLIRIELENCLAIRKVAWLIGTTPPVFDGR